MRPAAVLFDCDGVLVDSEPMLFDLLAEDLAEHGLPLPRDVLERDYIGGTMGSVADRARAAGALLPDEWVRRFYDKLYRRFDRDGVPLVPGVAAVLDALDAAGIPYAVGSNGEARKMEVTLGQHPDIYRRLRGRLFSGQEMGHPKPAPDLYLAAAAALGTPPDRCVVIEDSPTGATAARAAAIPCLGYAPHDDGARLAAVGASVFHDMAELPGLLGL